MIQPSRSGTATCQQQELDRQNWVPQDGKYPILSFFPIHGPIYGGNFNCHVWLEGDSTSQKSPAECCCQVMFNSPRPPGPSHDVPMFLAELPWFGRITLIVITPFDGSGKKHIHIHIHIYIVYSSFMFLKSSSENHMDFPTILTSWWPPIDVNIDLHYPKKTKSIYLPKPNRDWSYVSYVPI
jgi:hypothetical protein